MAEFGEQKPLSPQPGNQSNTVASVHQAPADNSAKTAMRVGEMEYLEERINTFHLNQRLGIEQHHEARVLGQGRQWFHLENWYSLHTVIRATLRALNLRKRGERNVLDIQLVQHDIYLQDLPAVFEGYRLLHLSDLHLDINAAMPDAVVKAVSTLDYDTCVMTGDYRAKTWGNSKVALDGLQRVKAALNGDVYAVLGNHDSIRMLPYMEDMGLNVLVNESVSIERDGESIYLAGIDDPHYYRSDNMELACDQVPRSGCSILLSHSPEMYLHAACAEFDLMLCGHTHGGQICLPGGIPLIVNAKCPRRYCRGLWQFAAMQGYTSVGCGASVVDARFNCAPEVTLLRLFKEKQSGTHRHS